MTDLEWSPEWVSNGWDIIQGHVEHLVAEHSMKAVEIWHTLSETAQKADSRMTVPLVLGILVEICPVWQKCSNMQKGN